MWECEEERQTSNQYTTLYSHIHLLSHVAPQCVPQLCIQNVLWNQKYVGHSQKRNAMPKGNELTLRIHSQLRRVYCKSHSRKISTICPMFLPRGRSILCWAAGIAAQWQYAQPPQLVVSKKRLEEESFEKTIFTSWCLITKNSMEISDSQKFPSVLQSLLNEGPQHSSLGTTPWSVYLLLPHVTWHHCTWQDFQAFSLLFTYWKQSNTGGGESLGRAKICLNHQTFEGKIMFTRVGVAEYRMRGGEMLLTPGVDWQLQQWGTTKQSASAQCFRKVAGVSIDTAGRWSAVDTFTIDSRVT